MTNYPTWRAIRPDLVAEAGGDQAIAEARKHNQTYIDNYRAEEAADAAREP
ncbi:hypothetical protein [Actinocorallia sp. A-T 12471]|uniref:hypothetical protein n=1 Tax=Actinocorallia sp. A-T 12471 TaxID=3089813 RepID=UPI0029CCAEFA|nr:hypothetical protein [Actinocorallia sp. A-T 12471]MDX6743820.1 hypothetical protein [Actinocorallia sp. A-T 12471]